MSTTISSKNSTDYLKNLNQETNVSKTRVSDSTFYTDYAASHGSVVHIAAPPQVKEGTVAALCAPTTPLSSNKTVIAGLVDHAQKQGCPLNKEQIKAYVACGERILGALAAKTDLDNPGELQITAEGQSYKIESCVYNSTAVIWAMYAKMAEQGTSLPDEGTVVLKDPGRKIGDFLKSAPTCYNRISSHYNERAFDDQPKKYGQPVQYGIENYRNHLPGEGGSILFSNIKATAEAKSQRDELFLKIEKQGTPGFFTTTEAGENPVKRFTRVFKAIAHCIAHSLSFIETRKSRVAGSEVISRKEHVHKDGLKNTIWEPFKALVTQQITDKKQQETLLNNARTHGLGKIESWLKTVEKNKSVDTSTLDKLNTAIRELHKNDVAGIGRRGDEVHVDFYATKTEVKFNSKPDTSPSPSYEGAIEGVIIAELPLPSYSEVTNPAQRPPVEDLLDSLSDEEQEHSAAVITPTPAPEEKPRVINTGAARSVKEIKNKLDMS